MKNQKGISPILIVLLIALMIAGYFIYQKQTTQPPLAQPDTQSQSTNEELTKYEKMKDIGGGYSEIQRITSPNGQYIAIKGQIPDMNVITIKDKSGKIIHEGIIQQNNEKIWSNMKRFGLKGEGQVGYSIKEWKDNRTFILGILVADGSRFEVDVDVTTGNINETTFRSTK